MSPKLNVYTITYTCGVVEPVIRTKTVYAASQSVAIRKIKIYCEDHNMRIHDLSVE